MKHALRSRPILAPPFAVALLCIATIALNGLSPAKAATSALSSVDRLRANVCGSLITGARAGGVGWSTLWADGFEQGLAQWTVTDISGVGVQWGDWDCWSSTGSRSAGCAAAGVSTVLCDEPYESGMKTWLVRGPFAVDSNLLEARLSFQLNLDAEQRFDGFFAGVSVDGVNFDGLALDGTVTADYSIDLSSSIGAEEVWIGFLFYSDDSGARPNGAQLDDVRAEVRAPLPPAERYGWSISDSLVDPFSNRGPVKTGTVPLYLWFVCSPEADGMSAADMTIESRVGAIGPFFFPANGFLNAGNATRLLLSVGGCPRGPVHAGTITMTASEAGLDVCIVPSNGLSDIITVDCQPSPGIHPSDSVGYKTTNLGPSTCASVSVCGQSTTSIQPMSWGGIRALYR